MVYIPRCRTDWTQYYARLFQWSYRKFVLFNTVQHSIVMGSKIEFELLTLQTEMKKNTRLHMEKTGKTGEKTASLLKRKVLYLCVNKKKLLVLATMVAKSPGTLCNLLFWTKRSSPSSP